MPTFQRESTPSIRTSLTRRSGVTAASVALAEAGVQMYGLVTGTYAVRRFPLSLDPS